MGNPIIKCSIRTDKPSTQEIIVHNKNHSVPLYLTWKVIAWLELKNISVLLLPYDRKHLFTASRASCSDLLVEHRAVIC